MTVSTKGRYALRVMVDLAEHASGDFIPLRAIAGRQNMLSEQAAAEKAKLFEEILEEYM